MSYTTYLPAWTVGTDCYEDIYRVACQYGKSAVIIGGKNALAHASERIQSAVAKEGFTVTNSLWYGGNSTYENAEMLENMDDVKSADMIFAVGGGRAMDLCKLIAFHLDKPLLTFPTIASTCAATTAIAVFYNPDGSLRDYFYPERCPQHCFINTQVIAEAPQEYLWAGIGDGLSKGCEVELATRAEKLFHTTYLGTKLALACTDPLLEFGLKALEECKENVAGYALEQTVLTILISTGLAANCVSHPTDYHYNSSLAHAVYNGATTIPNCGHKHLHGEIVAFGVLTLLTYDENFEVRDRILAFNHALALPITLDAIDLTPEDLQTLTDKAATVLEWSKVPYEVTKEKFIQAMLDADAAGKAFLSK